MKYADPNLLDQLAREYVIGTLRGAARRRFDAVCRNSEPARRSVRDWEDRLLGLSLALAPVQPSTAVWPAVLARVEAGSGSPRAGSVGRSRRWQFAIAAMLALVAAGLGWFVITRTGDPTAIATLAPEGGAAIWRVETYADRDRLRIVVAGDVPLQAGRSYELWALPEGGAPVSLGLMPVAEVATRRLSEPQRAALARSAQVAVSLEPVGGSPTGAPTGPVLYVGPLSPVPARS